MTTAIEIEKYVEVDGGRIAAVGFNEEVFPPFSADGLNLEEINARLPEARRLIGLPNGAVEKTPFGTLRKVVRKGQDWEYSFWVKNDVVEVHDYHQTFAFMAIYGWIYRTDLTGYGTGRS